MNQGQSVVKSVINSNSARITSPDDRAFAYWRVATFIMVGCIEWDHAVVCVIILSTAYGLADLLSLC